MKTFYTIALSGLSETDAKQVFAAIESPKLGKWSPSEGGSSDLLIIDVDSVWGHMDWLRAVAEDRLCAAYTEQSSMRDCDLLLQKPLNSDKLIQMLLDVQNGAPAARKPEPAKHQAASAPPTPKPEAKAVPQAPAPMPTPAEKPAPAPAVAPAPVAASPAAPAKTAPKPAAPVQATETVKPAPAQPARDETLGTLLLDGAITDMVLVEGAAGDAKLAIDPINNIYRAPPQLKSIEKLLDVPASRIRPVSAQDAAVQHAGPEQPIVRLLWFAALCASHGELAPHLDPASTWRLTRWPQIEREFPRHFRIATAMMKQPATLEEIADAAKSPVGDVAGFINAYYVAGYVAPEGAAEPTDNSTSNVLGRLRRSFSRNAREASA
ncbi:hypothetical protein [Oleiagrimonas soli]|uniref:Uncharacterized protein n=1 Tax=Oleiagrimonas soli TaxID=1543381 RepID=A0A099CVH2_9GAMM|nr:hypothetical protein [Oleiagrimonas soli]KGI77681.1 hypothetical protein LF63_0110440 [Oleiagrimonas soli]MBB6182793.1 hypothetical protein [Oleiagrimonas soli]